MPPARATRTDLEHPSTGRRAPAIAIALALSAGAVACGGDAGDGDEAQPLPDATAFAEGGFDELPRYPGAESASEPATQEDVTSQSFTVATATPERVMGYFEDELEVAGWTAVEAPTLLGAESTYRGRWRQGGRQLVVSATEFSGFDDPGETRTTQYSLTLGPA